MSKSILYVDDEPYFVGALIEALKDEGYEVDQAVDGTQALERLEQSVPDLIVMDIVMPTGGTIMDTNGGRRTGLHDLKIIREKMGLRVPVVFVTVVDDPTVYQAVNQIERKFGLQTKSAILVKPVLPTELIDQVISIIGAP